MKQKKFADEYIISGNATQAAIKAGYSKKYTNTNANKLLQNTTVREYIDKIMAKHDDKKIAKQEEVLEYLTCILRGEQTEETLKGAGNGVQVIDDIEVSAKDRIKAAELLGKRYGIWTDRVSVDEPINITIKRKDD